MVKAKLKDLHPNPKHNGVFYEDQLEVLESSIKTIGIMGSFSVFIINNKKHLVSGHHRHKIAIKLFGKEHEVEIKEEGYDEDTAEWGMRIENLTQQKDVKKVIDELVGIRESLIKRFPNYQALNKFLKNKCTGVENLDSSEKIKYKDGTRKKGEQHYPKVGSSRTIFQWLNRKGNVCKSIKSFQDVNMYLQIYDNLDKSLYKKIQTGVSNEEDDQKKDKINFSNCKLLAQFKDKKEQKEVLSALQNTRTSRSWRVRTRAKLVTEYKKATDKVKTSIRKGEMDIADSKSKIIVPKHKATSLEIKAELLIQLGSLKGNIKEVKKILNKLPTSELELLFYVFAGWCKDDLSPFINQLIKEIKKKKKGDNVPTFEIITDSMKGGLIK